MAVNIDPIFPASPTVDIADLSAATPLTSRATITGTTGLTALTTTTTNGKRIDSITVKMSNTVAGAATNVFIWINNGTNSYLFDEFDMSAVTPGNTTDSAVLNKSYTTLVLPPTYRLYVSTTVSSGGNANCSVFAFGGNY
jgi:hypothetical protein